MLTKEKATKIIQEFGPREVTTIRFQKHPSGTDVFGVFIVEDGKIREVTNYLAIVESWGLDESCGQWRAKCNPGGGIEQHVQECWDSIIEKGA